MKLQILLLPCVVSVFSACDSEAPTRSGPVVAKSSQTQVHTVVKPKKTLQDDEPHFKKRLSDVASRRSQLAYGRIHPDLPGEGDHILDKSQTELCFESITSVDLPVEAEFVSGRMKRLYSFTKERNPIRNSAGSGALVFRIPRTVAGGLMKKILVELNRLDDQNDLRYAWTQWEGKKDSNGSDLVPEPLLDGGTSFRYRMTLSSDVHSKYYFIYESASAIFRIEYTFDNTRDG
jgi:hypothetical protein